MLLTCIVLSRIFLFKIFETLCYCYFRGWRICARISQISQILSHFVNANTRYNFVIHAKGMTGDERYFSPLLWIRIRRQFRCGIRLIARISSRKLPMQFTYFLRVFLILPRINPLTKWHRITWYEYTYDRLNACTRGSACRCTRTCIPIRYPIRYPYFVCLPRLVERGEVKWSKTIDDTTERKRTATGNFFHPPLYLDNFLPIL